MRSLPTTSWFVREGIGDTIGVKGGFKTIIMLKNRLHPLSLLGFVSFDRAKHLAISTFIMGRCIHPHIGVDCVWSVRGCEGVGVRGGMGGCEPMR